MTEPFYKRQPVLVGCLGCVGVSMLAMCGAGIFMGLLGKGCVDKLGAQMGVESLPALTMDAMGAGFGLEVDVDESGGRFRMVPMQPRRVTCDDLHQVVFPHLTGSLAVLSIESVSHEEGPDGRVQPVQLTCEWTGFPTIDTPSGSGAASSSAPAPSPGLPLVPPVAPPPEPSTAPEAEASPGE